MMKKLDPDHVQERPVSEGGKDAGRAETTSGMGRRDFLQVGLLGVAAASCAGVSPVVDVGGTGKEAGGTGSGRAAQLQDVSAVKGGDPETWNEPWVWRPSDWPGQQLHLNVVENQNPGKGVGLGNPGSILFSYGGNTPGPTIRMKGDETLFIKLRNLLSQDFGETYVGPFPHDTPTSKQTPDTILEAARAKSKALGNFREDFCLGEHTNGVHSIHVTNLHTHGLHVSPSRNPNGTHSDNVILRVLSQADFRRREQEGAEATQATEASCLFLRDPQELYFLRDDEVTGQADYEFRLGNVQRKKREREGKPPQPHPAGTFWYHPHAHGATHNQVASGMAGFLLVEGDIEEAVNRVLVDWQDGQPVPDPSLKTGPYDYRERLMFIQRVLNLSTDKDASKRSPELSNPAQFNALTNGGSTPTVIKMRPGAVERWRMLNGSVDGRGYKRFMVVKGQFTVQLDASDGIYKTYEVNAQGQLQNLKGEVGQPVDLSELELLEARKQDVFQLSIDGVTLVQKQADGSSKYIIKDLSQQGTDRNGNPLPNPLWTPDAACKRTLDAWIRNHTYTPGGNDTRTPAQMREDARQAADVLCRLYNVWKTPASVKNCFVRPNEFYTGPANRTDFFFKAPPISSTHRTNTVTGSGSSTTYEYDIYTVLAKAAVVHSDTPERNAQLTITGSTPKAPEDVIIAYVLVEQVAGTQDVIAPFDMRVLMQRLEDALPPVQEYLLPIEDDELKVTSEEVDARSDVQAGDYRTRRVLYSGWGHPSMPLVSTDPSDPSAQNFQAFIDQDDKKHENLFYAEYPENSGLYVMMAPEIRTMAISFDNPNLDTDPASDDPLRKFGTPRKFDPTDPFRARMLENTAEEWTLYNLTNTLWGNTGNDPNGQSDDPLQPNYKQPSTQYSSHYFSYPISRERGQQAFLNNPDFQLVSRGIDHPFHIHQNPFWVSRIEIPDEKGDLVNILDEPRWMDSIWIPRNRGRIGFRMRFPDYVGAYVHHCHILLHEDNGMMHVIEATPFADKCNYNPQQSLDPDANAPRPTREESYTLSYSFDDPDETTGQRYPGFTVKPPQLP